MSSEPIVVLDRASKVYRQYRSPADRLKSQLFGGWINTPVREYRALQDVTLSLRRGESLGVVGLNGAGKSTLLQLLAGTIQPSSGAVHVRGRVAALLELGSGFNPEFSGLENIFLNAATLGLTRRQIEQRLDDIIAFSGLREHIDNPVKTYSTGMFVRLAFSIATSVEPDILIIDEALSVGDGAFAKKSFDRIRQIKSQGASILFCSHALFHVDVFCDKTLWLERGSVREWGPTRKVLPRYQEYLEGLNAPAPSDQHAMHAVVPDVPTYHDSPLGMPVHTAASGAEASSAKLLTARVSLDGVAGEELHGTSRVSTLGLEIDFASDPQAPCPRAAIVVSSEQGRILASGLSPSAQVFDRDSRGRGTAHCVIPNLPFNRGRYRIGAYLLCDQARFVYEMIDPCAHINLEFDGVHQGHYLMDGQWS